MSGPQAVVIACTALCDGHRTDRSDQDVGSDAARLIERAGRCCYDSWGTGRGSAAFHEHILAVGHGSVLEHASISFYLSGISRGCSHEWVRHRVGVAISQRSTRYVDETESPMEWHPLISRLIPQLPEEPEFIEAVSDLRSFYRTVYGGLVEGLIARGVESGTARKQARGAARGLLPGALSTAMVWTANIRALRHIIAMRASEHADGEIRLLANRVYEAAREVVPEYFADGEQVACADGIGYAVRWKAGD